MGKAKKTIMTTSIAAMILFGVVQTASAMHIMEGYLPVGYAVAWGVLCIPFIAAGVMRIQKLVSENRKVLLIFAMTGAYAFVLSALKIPSVTGSSSHPTGTGLAAILFGATPASVIGVIVLLFQAILLAHGGLTTLGANTFSMGIAGPFVSAGIYALGRKLKLNRMVSVFLGASLGDLVTYCVTSFQLALATPMETGGVVGSLVKFMGIFAATQVPLAVIEGLLTVVVVIGLESLAKPELAEIGFLKEGSAA